MSKLRLLTLVGLMAAALTPLYGCGSECAEGTADQDGQCVVAAKGCAEGTTLQNGECRLDTSGCGEGTMFSEGECVPTSATCSGNTSFDEGTLNCVPNTDVICGAGTKTGEDGYCIPDAEACSDKTVFENGRCVIAAASCGEGTALDPNTGECLLAEEGCSAGLAFDSESNTCVPTEEICDAGTKFDAESGLCLPDSCSRGDVVIDGVCMTPAEDLASNPDLTENENNDPALGGTADGLFVDPADDDGYIFSGAIGTPSDLDGDGEADQDVDVYEFEAGAGEWFEIRVLSTGLQAPAFVVEGPDDYIRYSPIGRAQDATRQIVAPADGMYTITVLPSLVLQTDGEVTRIGGDDWTYVGSLTSITPPAGADVDLSSANGQISGDYLDLTDNFFNVTGLTVGDIVTLTFEGSGDDTDALVQVRDTTGVLTHSESARNRGSVEFVAAGPNASILLDWIKIDGPATDFSASVAITGSEKTTTMPPGASESFTLNAAIDDQIVATQSNPQGAELSVTIVEVATGDELDAEAALASGAALMPLVTTPGDYKVTFTNNSASNVDATVTAKLRPPFRLGLLDPGMSANTNTFELSDGGMAYVTFSVGAGQMIEISHDNDQGDDHDFELYDDQGTEVEYDSYFNPLSYNFGPDFLYYLSAQGGAYRLEVEGRDDVTNEIIYVDTFVPEQIDLLTQGTSATRTVGATNRDQRRWYMLNVGEAGKLKTSGSSDNGEDIDLYVYDMTLSPVYNSTASGGIASVEDVTAGQYMVAIEPDYAVGSFEVSFDLLAPPPPPQFTSAPGLSIPDNDTTGVSDTMTVSGCPTISDTSVYLNITHSYRGDLEIDLTSPAGTKVRIWDDTGSYQDDLIGWLPLEWTPTNSLSAFSGESGNGDWTITVADDSAYGTGTLHDWGLTLTCQ